MRNIVFYSPTHLRQHLTKFIKSMKLGLVAYNIPVRMIFVLFPPADIITRYLNMTIDVWANPHTCAGWRNYQLLDPKYYLLIFYNFTTEHVPETTPTLFANNSGAGISHVLKTGNGSRAFVIPMHSDRFNAGNLHGRFLYNEKIII